MIMRYPGDDAVGIVPFLIIPLSSRYGMTVATHGFAMQKVLRMRHVKIDRD